MEVDEDTRQGQGHMPKKGQGHNSPRKGQMQTTPVRTPKRRRNDADDDGEKGTPLKVRKMERKSTPNTPKLTGLKQNHNNQDGYQLVSSYMIISYGKWIRLKEKKPLS